MSVEAILATWPASEFGEAGGFRLRRDDGSGNRTSAATLEASTGDIAAAEAAMRAWGQRPLFMIRPGEEALDAELDARGYAVHDASLVLAARCDEIGTGDPERASVGDMLLRVMADVWANGGIGADRLAVMARAPEPKAYVLGRTDDSVVGAGFVAGASGVAVLHALEIAPAARRRGVGGAMTRSAGGWADEHGMDRLLLAVTRANADARAVYGRLGFTEEAAYHYRRAPDAGGTSSAGTIW